MVSNVTTFAESRRRGAVLGTRAAVLAVALLAGCGSHSPARGGGQATPSSFSYDRGAPLAFHDRGVVNHGYPIKVHDVSFAGARGSRVYAYLVVPPTPGRHPAVIYLHGSGENRLRFVLPA